MRVQLRVHTCEIRRVLTDSRVYLRIHTRTHPFRPMLLRSYPGCEAPSRSAQRERVKVGGNVAVGQSFLDLPGRSQAVPAGVQAHTLGVHSHHLGVAPGTEGHTLEGPQGVLLALVQAGLAVDYGAQIDGAALAGDSGGEQSWKQQQERPHFGGGGNTEMKHDLLLLQKQNYKMDAMAIHF